MVLDRVLGYLCRCINCGVYEKTSFSGLTFMRVYLEGMWNFAQCPLWLRNLVQFFEGATRVEIC